MYLVTEYMQGGDLGGKLHADKAHPRKYGWYQDGRFILLGVARGLAYLHSKRIVWFDCKPGNVLLDHTGRVAKIADFGLARILESTYVTGCVVRAHPAAWHACHCSGTRTWLRACELAVLCVSWRSTLFSS